MTSELRPAVEVWDDAIAAWAADTIDTRQAAAAVIQAYGEAVRAPLLAEIERLTIQLEVESEPSPYCPICGSCGEDGCCGPQRCLYPTTEQASELAKYKALAETLATDLRECARALQSLHQIPGTGADGRLWQRIKEITGDAHAAVAQYKEARDAS